MELFFKYQVIIARIVGIAMLLAGISLYFWGNPKQSLSANERAMINVARMEAKVSPNNTSQQRAKPDISGISKTMAHNSKKKNEYLMILAIILGILFLGYSFIRK